jgi:uncharacterized protein (DUF2147 family)
MKFLLFTLALLMPLFTAQAKEVYDPTGYWLTENERAVIYVKNCDQGLCGSIHWIIEGGMQFDEFNPDINRRQDPLCRRQIMSGFSQGAQNLNYWSGGEIYKADEGDTYDANLTVLSEDKMKVRGYIGISLLGKSQTWTRVSNNNYKQCRQPK